VVETALGGSLVLATSDPAGDQGKVLFTEPDNDQQHFFRIVSSSTGSSALFAA